MIIIIMILIIINKILYNWCLGIANIQNSSFESNIFAAASPVHQKCILKTMENVTERPPIHMKMVDFEDGALTGTFWKRQHVTPQN